MSCNDTSNISVAELCPGGGEEGRENAVRYSSWSVDIIYYVVGILGVCGNLLMIVVITNYKTMKQHLHDQLILNQSVVDMMSAITLILITATVDGTADTWDESNAWHQALCLLWYTSLPLWALFIISTVNLEVLTIERYLEVVHPLWHKTHVSKRQAPVLIGIIWCTGVYQIITNFSTSQLNHNKCEPLSMWVSDELRIFYGFFNTTIRFILPVLIMLYCYPAMMWKLAQQQRKIGPGTSQNWIGKARKNTVKTLITVALAYISCWIINQTLYIRWLCGYPLDFSSAFYNVSVVMVFSNCCINPFIYTCQYKVFQNGIRHLYKRIKRRYGCASPEDGDESTLGPGNSCATQVTEDPQSKNPITVTANTSNTLNVPGRGPGTSHPANQPTTQTSQNTLTEADHGEEVALGDEVTDLQDTHDSGKTDGQTD